MVHDRSVRARVWESIYYSVQRQVEGGRWVGEGHTTGASPASSLCPGSILVAQTKCVIESATNGHISAHYSACYYRDNLELEFGTQFYVTYVTLVY